MRSAGVPELIERLKKGEALALARAISWIENEDACGLELLNVIYPDSGRSYRIGISGPPGAGKSTLVDGLTEHLLDAGHTVGIIAVDPTSPFTGGALLGDRIRMQGLGTREGVFIRSMATRGGLGGLSRAAPSVAAAMDAAGLDYVIFETVGVGQSELDIAEAADTTVIVLVPESGDSIQAMKAGLMEIGEIFIVNKADRDGADMTEAEISSMLTLKDDPNGWHPPVLKTVASTGEGIAEVAGTIEKHRQFLLDGGLLQKRRRDHFKSQVRGIIVSRLERKLYERLGGESGLDAMIEDVTGGYRSPYQVATEVIDGMDGGTS
ncbi:MAG: methylmalonyl Co-A mutase-associated GTPase MeaB [Candidatus Eisenbacteria bacterium]